MSARINVGTKGAEAGMVKTRGCAMPNHTLFGHFNIRPAQ